MTVSAQPTTATHADSGWVPLFNGTNLNGLYPYLSGQGIVAAGSQTTYTVLVDSTMIRVSGSPAGFLGTTRQYSHYHVRVQYRWPTGTSTSANAGLLVHIDSVAMLTYMSGNRPRSIEINCRRDTNYPWSLWSGQNFGPYITTTVNAIPNGNTDGHYQAGGTVWTNDPWQSQRRVISGDLQPNPELPTGQWNTGEAYLYGDSGTFILNGQVRTKGWNFKLRGSANDSATANRKPCTKGVIGLQSESGQIFYRNYEIMELDSVTNVPVNALRGCTIRTATNYNPRAVVNNGSCTGVTAIAAQTPHVHGFAANRILNGSGAAWVNVPEGYTGIALYNLRGRKVWFHAGTGSAKIPDTVEKGLLRIRLMR